MPHKHHHHGEEKPDDNQNEECPENEVKNAQEGVEIENTPPPREPKPVTLTDIELEKLKADSTDNRDKYLRLLAESENARKRMQKEKQELVQYAIQNVIADFINPIDHMENALKYTENMSEEIKHWALGFQMILGQFKDVLNGNGVHPMNTIGTKFDPHLHEAIEMVESDQYAPGFIVEESLKGYKMGDKMIRPAKVKVSKEKTNDKTNDQGV
jgi:molecular chaperone GrpE